MNRTHLNVIFLIFVMLTISCNNKSENHRNNPDSKDQIKEQQPNDSRQKQDTLTQNKAGDWLLVPGKSAGKTQINQDTEQVFKNLGKPDGGDAAMGKSVAIWYAHHDSTSYATAIYATRDMGNSPQAFVRQIRITSPSFKTKENIRVTSDLPAISKIFQLQIAEKFKDADQEYTVYDSREGIAFEINEDKKCVAIIIHEPGKAIPGTYLKFRTTNKFINKR
jgi:hypothetical protein